MKIKAVHLLSRPDDERERRCAGVLAELPRHGIELVSIVNPVWTGDIPEARFGPDRPFVLTPAMYGCWKAHRDAITEHLHDVDALLVNECDCLPVDPMPEFVRRVRRAADACVTGHLDAFQFGFKHDGQTLDRVGDDVIVISQWIGTHCYLVPMASRGVFLDMFSKPWDAYDYCVTIYLFDQLRKRIGTFSDRPVAVQADGLSLISGCMGVAEKHYSGVRYE